MRIATDIGGTFTDLVALDEGGKLFTIKGDTTPPDFERGIIETLTASAVNTADVAAFIHGTTTIINAITERKGAKTGLITTKGFRDVLEIARCNRPDLFNLVFAKPSPFIPRYLRHEIEERISADGDIIVPLNRRDIENAVAALKKDGAEAIAVCFINSYANDAHERETAGYIAELWPEVFVSYSGQITREWREYERTSTVALNAYVGPVASLYVHNLENRLRETGIVCGKYIMQSNGGSTPFRGAVTAPINMVESGPVAGVFGVAILGKLLGESRLISFDVGGTTAKCSLIDNGEVKITTNYRVERTDRYAGYPIMTPVVDIVEIGNGGGSIAWIDDTGSLKVGPKSAGALPGPVAYGKGGTEPTTTDACLVAGRLSPVNFDRPVNIEAVKAALTERVGKYLGLDAEETAVGVIRVAEANMHNALKLISVRRGYDPRNFTLVAYGGGGPMHASALARELGIGKIVIPVCASVFSAWGMLMTDIRHDYIHTNISPLDETSSEDLTDMWKSLAAQAAGELDSQGIPEDKRLFSYYADMRYAQQEHAVKVQVPPPPWDSNAKDEIVSRFHAAHEHYYTFRLEGTPVEIVNLHLAVHGLMDKPNPGEIKNEEIPLANLVKERRRVYFSGDAWQDAPVYDMGALFAGAVIDGPAVVEEKAAATLVERGQKLTVDVYGNLILETGVK
ncbi:MAG: hydantoinase/oxoprolinase family protein [Synergistaceae bacterium]|jgi:N-methylhydantoinase A|nr:hydantoinase/oxoprolinase family protein [Synergistaceae bacterium]